MDWQALAASSCAWLSDSATHAGVVLSSRVRLSRNVASQPFPQRAPRAERDRLLQTILDTAAGLAAFGNSERLALDAVEPLHRQLLGERQVLSRDLIAAPAGGGLVLSGDTLVSCMVNEEDHLRFQALRPGLDLEGAAMAAEALEQEIGKRLEYAYAERFGFLTACPTNTGTGLRASALIHLPGILMQEQSEKLQEVLRKRRLTIRGFYGEGSAALGYIFQISNAATLGVREGEILAQLEQAVTELAMWEIRAREALLAGARSLLEDKIWRAFGILRHARLLTAPEAFLHASLLRLGTSVGVLQVPVQTLNEILIQCQPAHAQLLGRADDSAVSDAWRADTVRGKLRRFAA
jgi:protein arginine kinase